MSVERYSSILVGLHGTDLQSLDLSQYECISEWASDKGLDVLSEVNEDPLNWYYGFKVPEFSISELELWNERVLQEAARFEDITGLQPKVLSAINSF